MKNIKIIFALMLLLIFASCKKEVYSLDQKTMEINAFVWKAMNAYYLWKNDVPDLSDSKFESQKDLNRYLEKHSDSKRFFEHLIYDREHIDKWSWIVDDYKALIRYFQGERVSSGMKIGLVREAQGSDNLFAYVQFVLPDSDAATKGIQRGNVFRIIDNQRITVQNYQDLLSHDSYDIELATWNGNNLEDTGTVIHLSKTSLQENPIFIKKVIRQNGKKIGYLMYNGFTSTYDSQLNAAISYFQSEGIDDLIVDLRYNHGGSVASMQYFASMITGSFTGKTFLKYEWHPDMQAWMQNQYPESLKRDFINKMSGGEAINNLNLNRIYFITTKSSASASESLINCLKPYINVTQIGTETHGKYVASITLFDSPDFGYVPEDINPNHKWAIQPIVLKVANANNETDFVNGLPADIYQHENYQNLGILGNETEPLLQRTLQEILGTTAPVYKPTGSFEEIYYTQDQFEDEMYLERESLKFMGAWRKLKAE